MGEQIIVFYFWKFSKKWVIWELLHLKGCLEIQHLSDAIGQKNDQDMKTSNIMCAMTAHFVTSTQSEKKITWNHKEHAILI